MSLYSTLHGTIFLCTVFVTQLGIIIIYVWTDNPSLLVTHNEDFEGERERVFAAATTSRPTHPSPSSTQGEASRRLEGRESELTVLKLSVRLEKA